MEEGMEGKEFEGLPRKRLSLGWIEMEQSQALNGLDRRQGMFFLRSKSRCSENRKQHPGWVGETVIRKQDAGM